MGLFRYALQQQITLFNEEDFVFGLGGPEPDDLVDNFQLRGVNLNQLPALEGQGIHGPRKSWTLRHQLASHPPPCY